MDGRGGGGDIGCIDTKFWTRRLVEYRSSHCR